MNRILALRIAVLLVFPLWAPGAYVAAADFVVTNVNNSGVGSLRQAVMDANANAEADTITFEDGVTGTITLGGTQLEITTPMTITGPGAKLLTISGNDASRIFKNSAGGPVTIRGMTLTAGRAGVGGAIHQQGGAASILTLEACRIIGSTADHYGGGIYIESSTVTIRDCTISDNIANGGGSGGGGIGNIGTLTILTSTLSGNRAPNASAADGGGGAIISTGTLTILHSTITGNRVSAAGGGGIYQFAGSGTMHNTIVAGNFEGTGSAPSDIAGTVTTGTHNLIGDAGSSGGLVDGTNGNLVGVGGSGTIDIATILAPLADNGGPTPTHALVLGSPAIDAGDPAFDGTTFTPALTTDQRGTGFDRIVQGLATSPVATVDIGAYELFAAPVTVTHRPSALEVERPRRFQPTEVGRRGGTQRIRIINTGGLPLTGVKVRLSGPHRKDFKLGKLRVTTLPASGSTVYRISFKPRSGGTRKATITVSGGNQALTTKVSGVGRKGGPPFPTRAPNRPYPRVPHKR